MEIRADKETERDEPFDQVWCVFDRDSFLPQQFNAAIELAVRKGFPVAYSNEAFEIWYLLHFDFHNTGISRKLYKSKLTDKLGIRYEKNFENTYDKLHEKGDENQAMKFADKLIRDCLEQNDLNPEKENPSTTVHFLVRELRNQSPRAPHDNALCHQVHQILRQRAGISKEKET